MARKSHALLPDWSKKIESLRQRLNLNQSEFSKRLSFSPMSASRWERGVLEPSEGAYIKLGNLAGDPLCWYFWRRAGISTADVMRVLPDAQLRLSQNRTAPIHVVHAGVKKREPKQRADFVAVPLLPVIAAALGEKGDREADLDQISPERLLAAPKEWCPNPRSTVCMRVKGNSMSPLILDGYIIAVDTSEVRHNKLIGEVVVAQNVDKGLLVSRLVRFDHTDALISDHREYDSVSATVASEWRIVGKVLWWTGKAR
jgi:phage repressor protein C with HTH and peptisase S24 domain/DNA-binding XRE family transcriptional regulator